MENKDAIKIIIIFGSSLLLFRLIRPTNRKSLNIGETEMQEEDPKDRKPIDMPTMSKKDAKANPTAAKAFEALRAYIAAYNAKEPQDKLEELNKEIEKDYGMRVYRRRQDNKLTVKDLAGKDIIINT